MIKFVEQLKTNEQPHQQKAQEKRTEQQNLKNKVEKLMGNVKTLQEKYIETLDEKILSKINETSKEIKEMNSNIEEIEKIIQMLVPTKVHMPKGQIVKELGEALNKAQIEKQLQRILEAKESYLKEIAALGALTATFEKDSREVNEVKGLLDAQGIEEINTFARDMIAVMTPNKIYDNGFSVKSGEVIDQFSKALSNYSLAIRLLNH